MPVNLDVARFVAGGLLLAYASVSDLRTRRVPNPTWLVGAAAGLALMGADAALHDRIRAAHLLAAGLIIALAYVLWYLHLIAGGADAKALMTLAVLLPLPVEFEVGAHELPLWTSPFPTSFVAFANSLLAFLAIPLVLLTLNAARGHARFPAMLLGYRVPIDRAERSFVWPMERADADGRVRFMLFSSRLGPEEHAANLCRLRELGRGHVWVTPKIPFMVPLLVGFLAAFTLGDLFTKFLVDPIAGR